MLAMAKMLDVAAKMRVYAKAEADLKDWDLYYENVQPGVGLGELGSLPSRDLVAVTVQGRAANSNICFDFKLTLYCII